MPDSQCKGDQASEKAGSFSNSASATQTNSRVVAQLDLNGTEVRVALWWGQFQPHLTNGYVTFADLLQFPDIKRDYEDQVVNSELVKEVRDGMTSVQSFVNHWGYQHHERSAANYPEERGRNPLR